MQSFIFIECPKRMELAIAVSGFNWIWPFDFMFWSYFIYQRSLKEILKEKILDLFLKKGCSSKLS